jgi:hypothetical protein
MVDVKTLESFKYAEPFRPFEIVLDDGRVVLVPWRETVGWSDEQQILMFPGLPDANDWTSFARVVELRPTRRSRRGRKAS